eukprot:SAG11_NODE_61_length_19011_cov_49.624048_15_plen_71_part_00
MSQIFPYKRPGTEKNDERGIASQLLDRVGLAHRLAFFTAKTATANVPNPYDKYLMDYFLNYLKNVLELPK